MTMARTPEKVTLPSLVNWTKTVDCVPYTVLGMAGDKLGNPDPLARSSIGELLVGPS